MNGMFNGEGTSFYKEGGKQYTGDWVNNQPHGHGVSFYEDSGIERHEGCWENGAPHGQGTSFHENGDVDYVGTWSYGIKEHFAQAF